MVSGVWETAGDASSSLDYDPSPLVLEALDYQTKTSHKSEIPAWKKASVQGQDKTERGLPTITTAEKSKVVAQVYKPSCGCDSWDLTNHKVCNNIQSLPQACGKCVLVWRNQGPMNQSWLGKICTFQNRMKTPLRPQVKGCLSYIWALQEATKFSVL